MSFPLALLIGVVLTPIAAIAGRASGLVDRPKDPALAIHARPVPILGGPAVVLSAFIAAWLAGRSAAGPVVAGVVIALTVGIVDDLRPLSPIARLAMLAVAGGVLASRGGELEALGVFARPTIVLVAVATANAVNLVDGQNGLAGGLAAAAALGIAGIPGGFSDTLALAFAGALVGFVVWNLRGSVFLGNGGAYAVGVALAALATHAASQHGWRGIIAAGLCLAVFGFELAFTILRRVGTGAVLTGGDRMHAYDLVSARTSRGISTAAFWGAGLAVAGVAVALSRLALAFELPITVAICACAAVWGRFLWRSIVREGRHT